MPIRAENRDRYPADWPQISKRIRAGRAAGRCECEGECQRGHLGRCTAVNGQPHPVTGSKVVLTVAHLNHQPEDCADANLRAMCQKCHLGYDQDHHRETRIRAKAARNAASGQDPLFTEDECAVTFRAVAAYVTACDDLTALGNTGAG